MYMLHVHDKQSLANCWLTCYLTTSYKFTDRNVIWIINITNYLELEAKLKLVISNYFYSKLHATVLHSPGRQRLTMQQTVLKVAECGDCFGPEAHALYAHVP